jgi:hypothetical protein
MFYDEDEDDLDIYEDDDEYDGDDEDNEDEDEDDDEEETLRELNVDENGHVIQGRRKKRRAGGYDDFEETNPEAYGYYD